MEKFTLSENFINKFKRKKPPFGFNGLGELVYMRTYSRIKEDGKNERWWETVRRVVEGTYSMQKNHIDSHQLGWNPWQAQKSAQDMYERIFNMKFLPPGRGLWAMGTAITEEKGLYAALNNCAFVSTSTIKDDYAKPFCFLMDASMLGVGVGFDTKGAGEIVVKGVNKDKDKEIYEIPDTREGWVESLRLLLESYFHGTQRVDFDYNIIRAEGEPIKGFGGVSSGPEPLKEVHEDIRKVLETNSGNPITITTIVDIMNLAISWQHTTDSVAGRSIGAMLLPHVTNSEAEGMIGEWSCIEFIHGEAYAHIVKQTRMNPDQALIDTYKNIRVLSY